MKETKDPAQCVLEWKAKDGVFRMHDRTTKETKILGDKLPFLVLDELISIRGVTKMGKEPIYSNEIRDLRLEELTIKTYSFVDGEKIEKVVGKGFWEEVRPPKEGRKTDAIDYGQKYCQVIYCAFWDGEIKFGKIELTGMAVQAWIEFKKAFSSQPKGVICDGVKTATSPHGSFFVPNFLPREISQDTADKAAGFKAELHKHFQAKAEPVIQVEKVEEDDDFVF